MSKNSIHEPISLMRIIIDRKKWTNRLFFTFEDNKGNVIMRSKAYSNIVSLIKGVNFVKNEIGASAIIYNCTI